MILNNTIVFLDFDKTLTDIHTSGFPDLRKSYWRSFTNKEMITRLLMQLKGLGCKLYLITRANENEVVEYIKHNFLGVFDGIKGNSQELVNSIGNNQLAWANWKVKLMQNILIELGHIDMSRVFFFDDTDINVTQALPIIPNSFKVDYESTHLFELLAEYVLPQTELVYNVPIYDIDRIYPPDGSIQFVLRRTSQHSSNKVVTTNSNLCVINIFTAVYTTHYKELFGVILDENREKRFVRFIDDDFKIDQHTLTINRIRNLDEFMSYIHNSHINTTNCSEHKFESKNTFSVNKFI